MFDEAGGVDRIDLSLTTSSMTPIPGPNPEDPPLGWEFHQVVDLEVHIGSTVYLAQEPSIFRVRPDPDDLGPNGETLWEIHEWYDLSPAQRGGTRSEEASWGTVKAMFL